MKSRKTLMEILNLEKRDTSFTDGLRYFIGLDMISYITMTLKAVTVKYS